MRRLSEDDDLDPDARAQRGDSVESTLESPLNLNQRRMQSVHDALKDVGANRVADLGCGEGRLLDALLSDGRFTAILGLDVSVRALERASRRLHLDSMAPRQRDRIQLIHGSLTYRDDRLKGWDAATAVEVVEHLDPYRLDAFAQSVFGHAQPQAVVVTTPNSDFNAQFPSLLAGKFRHPDHRFEWSRAEFVQWTAQVCELFGYSVDHRPIGDEHAELGAPPRWGGLHPMKITIPELSLVVLMGATSAGKSTFAKRHFRPTEIVSADACRALVGDDENALDVNREAFEIVAAIASARLGLRRLAVIDATNVQRDARKPLLALARENDCLPVAIVFDLPERILQDRSRERADRNLGAHVVRHQSNQLQRSLRDLQREGFRYVHLLRSPEDVESVVIERNRLWNDRCEDHGPFDIIGDIHGCHDELLTLLGRLGYVESDGLLIHPDGRRPLFLGDLVDRGPASPAVLRTVMALVKADKGVCVPGNHDVKLMRALQGKQVKIGHGLAESLAQF